MKLIEEKFRRTLNAGWNGVEMDAYFCASVMKDYFDIPWDCREIWISLFTVPTPDRLEMTVVDNGAGMFDLRETVEGKFVENGQICGCEDINAFLKKHVGKRLYVQVRYMG